MKQIVRFTLGALAAASFTLGGCSATGGTAGPTKLDAGAESTLRAMSDKLAGAQTFRVEARRQLDSKLVPGGLIKENAKITATVARPGRIRAETTDREGKRVFWYDGSTVTVFDAAANVYAATPAPPTIDAMFDKLLDEFGFGPPLGDFLVSDPYSSLRLAGGSAKLDGTEKVNGVNCNRISASAKTIKWDLWVSASDDLPRRFVVTYKDIPGDPQLRADFSSWDLGVATSASEFKAAPPSDAVQVGMIPIQ